MNIKQLFIAIVSVIFAGGVYAGEKMSAQDLDTDGDGYISSQEVQAHEKADLLTENWQQVDANQDGQVDISEFSAFEEQQLPQLEEQRQMEESQ
jgi:hypothetical protein